MDLLERYLQAVKFWLPGKQRHDILAELSEDIRSEIEDKEAALGRPVGSAELEADGAGQCDQGESADACSSPTRSLSLAAFAFDADEQPDCERGTETDDQLLFHTCFRCPMTSERMFCTGLRSQVKHGGSRRSIGQRPVRSTSAR